MRTEHRYGLSSVGAALNNSDSPVYDFQQQQPQFNFNFNSIGKPTNVHTVGGGNAAVGGGRVKYSQQRRSSIYSDRESVGSSVSAIGRGKRSRARHFSMKSSNKGVSKKSRSMDYTNYAYNEAVGRLKLMLADSYTPKITSNSYLRGSFNDDSDNFSDNLSAIERPVLSDISKYLSPSQKTRLGGYRSSTKKPNYGTASGFYSSSKENLAAPTHYQTSNAAGGISAPLDYYVSPQSVKPQLPQLADSVQAPVEIFNFIEKQEDYIEQLEKESKYCRNELTNLLGKVKDVINENEQLTEHARSELAVLTSDKVPPNIVSPSSDSEELIYSSSKKKLNTPRRKEQQQPSQLVKSPRYASAPNIVYEARISELEAELMQANIDLKRVKGENEELKRKLANADPLLAITGGGVNISVNCDTHRKQIEQLQGDKAALEDTIRHLQKSLDDAKSQQYSASTKRYLNDLVQMERSQSELEVKHLRDELDRQHERVRELQHEMARRIADERANAERRYNTQVDQLGGDLSNQWEQVAKLQLDLERQKRYETDLKRDLSNRNAQIDELKLELRNNRSTFLADMAQVSAEKQSLEQEITSLRLQLDRAAREAKTETARFTAEINSLRQRLDRGDADLLHSKREVLRLNDEIANLEKELAYGELKNEVRPTKKDLDKRISEMQEKHAETVNELEEMIQNQKQLMDKLTSECKTLTNKLEDTTLKHNQEKQQLRQTNEKLMARLKELWTTYKNVSGKQRRSCYGIRRNTASPTAATPSDTDSCREEHFIQHQKHQHHALNLTKHPHMSTSPPPHMVAAATPHVQPSMITSVASPPHIIMTPYWGKGVTHQPQATPMRPPHCPLPPLPVSCQQPPTISVVESPQSTPPPSPPARVVTTSVASAPVAAVTHAQVVEEVTASVVPPTDSMITNWMRNTKLVITNPHQGMSTVTSGSAMTTTTKISRTSSVGVKRNNNVIASRSQIQYPPQQQMSASKIIPNQMVAPVVAVWSHQLPVITTQTTTPTTVPMRATISNNTIPAAMTSSNMAAMAATNTADKVATATTMQAIMISPVISTIAAQSQPYQHQLNQQQQTRRQKSVLHQLQQHQHHHPHPRHLSAESPRTLLAVQQQRAVHNRERAEALWGRQVQLVEEGVGQQAAPVAPNQLCHNSLPRPLPKNNNCDNNSNDDNNAIKTPMPLELLDLEFSISSPSLIRSCDSDNTIGEFESLSEMSISPAHTAIHKLETPPQIQPSNGDRNDISTQKTHPD